jgi:hypothetical protein
MHKFPNNHLLAHILPVVVVVVDVVAVAAADFNERPFMIKIILEDIFISFSKLLRNRNYLDLIADFVKSDESAIINVVTKRKNRK